MAYGRLYRIGCCLLCITIMSSLWRGTGLEAQAAADSRPLSLRDVSALALANSKPYQKIQNQIEIQQVKYTAAVKSISMKKKNMATFRWTPLLSFKFPEKPSLVNEYEWQYKPVQITNEITVLTHKLTDTKMAVKEEVSNLYVEAYVCQEKIAFAEKRLAEQTARLKNNQIKLKMGEAKQADIDTMQKSIAKLNTELALQMRTFQTQKSKLSQLAKSDFTTGYHLLNPFVQADIPRSVLQSLTTYTLERDQEFYEIKLNTSLSKASVTLMEDFMENQYGTKMYYIQPFVRQALRGEEVDGAAFKRQYNQMLYMIDKPWEGYIRIIFFKIYREWFKGAKAGSRYVEDDPYMLYTATLEYVDALKEQQNTEINLKNNVASGFETLITTKNAYEKLKESNVELGEELTAGTELNRTGQLPFGELQVLQEEYEAYQIEELEALSAYSQILYSYDRLTCGGISTYLEGKDIFASAAAGGNSYIEAEELEDAYYYIESQIADNIFLFGVSIPDNFEPEITDFELHVDGTRIGEKTNIANVIRHLTLDLLSVELVQVYLYNEAELVDVCEIDSTINMAPLQIVGGYTVIPQEGMQSVATFTYEVDGNAGISELRIKKLEGEDIAYYRLLDSNGQALYQEDLISIADSFHYLSILINDFTQLRIQLYDSKKELLYTGEFYEQTLSIKVRR